jgi:hypothetical protein
MTTADLLFHLSFDSLERQLETDWRMVAFHEGVRMNSHPQQRLHLGLWGRSSNCGAEFIRPCSHSFINSEKRGHDATLENGGHDAASCPPFSITLSSTESLCRNADTGYSG